MSFQEKRFTEEGIMARKSTDNFGQRTRAGPVWAGYFGRPKKKDGYASSKGT